MIEINVDAALKKEAQVVVVGFVACDEVILVMIISLWKLVIYLVGCRRRNGKGGDD